MKKLTLAIAFLAVTFAASAQNNRFYISLQGGPQLSMSETTGGHSLPFDKLNAVPTWQTGIYGGYVFPNQKITIETGAQLARHDIRLDYSDRFVNRVKGLDIRVAQTAWQVPVRLKYAFSPAESKFRVSPIVGVKFFMQNDHTLRPETEFTKSLNKDEAFFYTKHHVEKNGRQANFSVINSGGSMSGFVFESGFLLIEGGLEVAYELNDKLSLVSSLIYQTGTANYRFYTYIHDNNDAPMEERYHTSSRAEAMALSFGLSYHFSNRDKE